MKDVLLFAPLLVLAAATAGCAGATPPPSAQLQDGTAIVKLEGHARFGGLDVVPLRIEEDSRCPAGVQCVWAGRVRVAVRIDDRGRRSESVLTLGQPVALEQGGWLSLAAVCPYPRHPEAIAGAAYRFTFVLRMRAPPPPLEAVCGA